MKNSRPTSAIHPFLSKRISTPKSPKKSFDISLNSRSALSSGIFSKSRSSSSSVAARFSINEKNETVINPSVFDFSPSGFVDHMTPKTDGSDEICLSFDLLKTMTPKNCIHYLNKTPLFLKTMVTEGQLSPDLVGGVSLSLTQGELQTFITNMTNELNIFGSIHLCESMRDAELKIMKLIPLTRVTFWNKYEYADFIYSPTLKVVLMLGKSIVCYPFVDKKDLITGDPGDHPAFTIDQDLPLLRTAKSMMLLPIFWPDGEIASILQCVGLKDQATDAQIEFNGYYTDTLKIIRDILQKKFYSQKPDNVVPSNVSAIFGELDKCSLIATVTQISKFLQNGIPCECADIFEFNDRTKVLTRLIDKTKFNEETGGISFKAALSTEPINLPHAHAQETLTAELDTKLANRSILSVSLFYHRQHFVVTLRGKPNSPAFNTADSQLVVALTPLICDSLKLSRWLEEQTADVAKVKEETKLMNIIGETLEKVSSTGCDKWEAIKNVAQIFFDCEVLFIAVFDGRYMKYTPTDYRCKFEECTAGTSYNFREPIWGDPDDEKSKFNRKVYDDLNVKCEYSFAFPYRTNGKVSGAIELINPKQREISLEKQKLFSNLCACLLSNE